MGIWASLPKNHKPIPNSFLPVWNPAPTLQKKTFLCCFPVQLLFCEVLDVTWVPVDPAGIPLTTLVTSAPGTPSWFLVDPSGAFGAFCG